MSNHEKHNNQTQHDGNAAIKVAVVGHTNTGKTSLIRTLLRSNSFGTIANAASTTRHVEQAAILVDGQQIISLYDTPGLEDASALLEQLQEQQQTIQQFLVNADQHPEFEQETKVLNQGINSDALLYVIDVRSQLLDKYRDEISVLSKLGKPIIPVFNFVTGNAQQLHGWREMMISHNLHAALEFDTVAFDFEAEKRLYQKLQGVLESRYQQLQTLIDARSKAWQQLCEAAVRRVLELLAKTATYRIEVSNENKQPNAKQQASEQLQKTIRQYEQHCLTDLLSLFEFTPSDVDIMQLAVNNGEWELDLFSANTLKMFGLSAGSNALKGAAAGAGIDLMVGGLTLGTGALIGAALGAGYSTLRRYGKDISVALQKNDWLCADDTTVELIYLRSQDLLRHLTHRGHATQTALTVQENKQHTLPEQWPQLLRGLRSGQADQQKTNKLFTESKRKLHDILINTINATES
ncbi:MAG: GTPase/DUF3482 domain-containing protein [Spongiibacteraceae bacterium]